MTKFERPTASRGSEEQRARRVIDALDAASMAHSVAEQAYTDRSPNRTGLDVDEYALTVA
jgi:hypothetical protein